MNERVSRVPNDAFPHSLDAEQRVLGAILVKPDLWTEVRDIVSGEDFFRAAHQVIFRRMEGLATAGTVIDYVTLVNVLSRHGELEEAGGPAYLSRLIDHVSVSRAMQHAVLVAEESRRRRAILIAKQLEVEAREADDVSEAITRTEAALRDVVAGRTADITPISDEVNRGMDQMEATAQAEFGITGVPTGFYTLDRMLGGLQKEDLIIMAARPSVGKTALACQVAHHAAVVTKVPTLFVTLETRASQLALRMASMKACVDLVAVRERRASDADLDRLRGALADLSVAPMTFLDVRDVRMSDVRRHARRLHAQGKCDLLVADYLTLFAPERAGSKDENRTNQVAAQTKLSKSIARELGIPFILLAQLSREYEKDGSAGKGPKKGQRRPRLSDLRESGSIEQDADVVLFVHRPYVRPTGPEEKMREGETELIVAKQRNGPIGHIRARYTPQWVRFDEMEGE